MFLQVPLTQQVESIIISVKGCADHSVLCVEKCLGKKRREYGCILCGKSIFSFKKNCQTISQSGCAIVRSHSSRSSTIWPAFCALSTLLSGFSFHHPVWAHDYQNKNFHDYKIMEPAFSLSIFFPE